MRKTFNRQIRYQTPLLGGCQNYALRLRL